MPDREIVEGNGKFVFDDTLEGLLVDLKIPSAHVLTLCRALRALKLVYRKKLGDEVNGGALTAKFIYGATYKLEGLLEGGDVF